MNLDQGESDLRQQRADAGVREPQGVKRLCWLMLALLIKLWGRTLRFSIDAESEVQLRERAKPSIFLLWHNRIFVAAEIVRRFRGRPIAALVSASNDGGTLGLLFRKLGLQVVRGSQNYRGAQALRELHGTLEEGIDIAITPDGSRGPLYEVKPGVLLLARVSKENLRLVGAVFSKAVRMNSWDGLYLPLPFSKVDLKCSCIESTDGLWRLSSGEQAVQLSERMVAMNPDLKDPPRVRSACLNEKSSGPEPRA